MNPLEAEVRYAIRLAERVHVARRMWAAGWRVQLTEHGARGVRGPAFDAVRMTEAREACRP